jgi:hypothetical protein
LGGVNKLACQSQLKNDAFELMGALLITGQSSRKRGGHL